MRAPRRLRPSPATVIASIALLVALAGTGYAATSLPKNSVGNEQLQANAVTSSKVKDHALLKVDFATNQLPRGPRGIVGPPGANGTQGARGPTGPAGISAAGTWAVVDANGTLVRSSAGVTVTHVAASGVYKVQFTKVITQCAWLATIRNSNFAFIETELFPSTTNAVRVETANPFTVSLEDRSFHLAVVC